MERAVRLVLNEGMRDLASDEWQCIMLSGDCFFVLFALFLEDSTMLKNFAIAVALAASVIAFSSTASASQVRLVGPVQEIQLAADGRSATVVVTNVRGGERVTLRVTDAEILGRISAGRINRGDEIRARFDPANNNLVSTFVRTAGC